VNAGMTAGDVQAVSGVILAWIGQGLLFGTVLAGLTWVLVRPVRGRASPTLEIAVWSIVLVKFLVPTGPGWSFSLASTFERLSLHAPSVLAGGGEVETGLTTGAAATADEQAQRGLTRGSRAWPWTAIVVAGYLLGVVGLGVMRIRSYYAFRARCLELPVADETTQELVHNVCRQLGVRRVPLIRVIDESRAPFVMGLLRPLLVLSRRQFVRPNELETVVVHEVTHLRRGDMFVRCLQCVAGTGLFFWPVVAWVNRRIDRVREYACDERALRHGRLTAGEYARCLLSAGQPLPAHRFRYQPACMAGNASTIERRIDVILTLPSGRRRRPAWALLTAAVLLAWGGFTLTGVAQDKGKAKGKKAEYTATEKSMRLHAQKVYARVNEHAAGDLDGNGEVTKEECWAFVAAAVLQMPDAVLKEYPKADSDKDGNLDLMEAYLFVRGDDVIAGLHKKQQPEIDAALKAGDKELAEQLKQETYAAEMGAWHFILDRRDALLDMMNSEPSVADVKMVAAKAAKLEAKEHAKKLAEAIGELGDMRKKAAALRAKAAEVGGDQAAKYEAKAQQLDQQADQLRDGIAKKLESEIAKLEAAGEQKKADELKAQLAELEEE
jgi:beta-lactamase regulating signal transducer with metallopeptidase domain